MATPPIRIVILLIGAIGTANTVTEMNSSHMTATAGDVPGIRGVAALGVWTRIQGGATIIFAHSAHLEQGRDSGVMQAARFFREETNGLLYIGALV